MKLESEDGAIVALVPQGYEFGAGAAPAGDWDLNWLQVRGEVRTSSGESWSFVDPFLTTWECADILVWLRACSRGEIQPTVSPSEDDGLLWFTEPNVAFSLAASGSPTMVVRVHLSLECAPLDRGPDSDSPLELYEYVVPISTTRAKLDAAADQWQADIASFPAR